MSLTLWEFKKYLKNDDFLLYNGINKYLTIENKPILKKIQKLIQKNYRFSELSSLMVYLLETDIRNEVLNIHNNGVIQGVGEYISNILVKDINYKLPIDVDFEEAKDSDLPCKNIFPYEDSFAYIQYTEMTEITPGFSLQKRNIKTDNGNDWIRHYIGRNDRGYIYKLKCERNGIIFYKIGITKNIEQRMRQISKCINIIDSEYFEDYMIINAIRERAFHEENITKKLHLNEKFDGCNECYVLNMQIPNLNKSLDILENKYTMDRKLLELILKEMKCNEQ
jgi:predicted GIY-YIG superfamily endonuclease